MVPFFFLLGVAIWCDRMKAPCPYLFFVPPLLLCYSSRCLCKLSSARRSWEWLLFEAWFVNDCKNTIFPFSFIDLTLALPISSKWKWRSVCVCVYTSLRRSGRKYNIYTWRQVMENKHWWKTNRLSSVFFFFQCHFGWVHMSWYAFFRSQQTLPFLLSLNFNFGLKVIGRLTGVSTFGAQASRQASRFFPSLRSAPKKNTVGSAI